MCDAMIRRGGGGNLTSVCLWSVEREETISTRFEQPDNK